MPIKKMSKTQRRKLRRLGKRKSKGDGNKMIVDS